jgi:hypothetical protein
MFLLSFKDPTICWTRVVFLELGISSVSSSVQRLEVCHPLAPLPPVNYEHNFVGQTAISYSGDSAISSKFW